ncbi:arsinothricin resistance N-acetyltransferase ArsN1 [bacterium BD-1]|uniref:arsinothricin resistance N-acetyltransferase ArsN1 family A n=1 Tax=Arenimonas sp. TaxID=1872635 RepID=UPI001E57EE0F|nr:arsinothricin resistance N-acetyltransferase ArsN1 [Ottowia caeni]
MNASHAHHRIRIARAEDATAIADIHNHGILGRQATFETRLRTPDEAASRIAEAAEWPLLVAEDDEGRVLGWAGLSVYRPRECYAGIGDFSIYLAPDARGRGLGTALLQALVDAARQRGFWKLVSRIFPENAASRALCRRCGFREVGTYEKHARLDGRWRDVVIVERVVPENLQTAAPAARSA